MMRRGATALASRRGGPERSGPARRPTAPPPTTLWPAPLGAPLLARSNLGLALSWPQACRACLEDGNASGVKQHLRSQ